MSGTQKPRLFRRLTRSVPILVTVIIHAVVIGIAGYFVTETIIGKKKTFEESPPMDTSFKKQVEHRLQVARKPGGAAPSPISAQHIVSTAADALQLPELPALSKVGASSLSGTGFMSMSFLGITSQRASKAVFIVDVGNNMLDIRKGGFEAFKIMREEMAKLVSRLPPSAEFAVVLFETGVWDERTGSLALFDPQLQPATVANKERFFAWLKPINADPKKLGMRSISGNYPWAAKELAKRKKENEEQLADMRRDGLDPDAVNAARLALERKARAQLDEINAKLKSQGKPPLIIQTVQRIFDADFQREPKRLRRMHHARYQRLVQKGRSPHLVDGLQRLHRGGVFRTPDANFPIATRPDQGTGGVEYFSFYRPERAAQCRHGKPRQDQQPLRRQV